MILYRVVTVICLAALIAELLYVTVFSLLQKRADRITFLRGFKKGKCIYVYFMVIPLYCIGHIEAGQPLIEAFFSAVHKTINLVVLKYETTSIAGLMSQDKLYAYTIYFSFVLVGLNAMLFTLSLISQQLWCATNALGTQLTLRDRLFVFGNNGNSISIYESDKKRNKTLVDTISSEDSAALYINKVKYMSVPSFEIAVDRIFSMARRREKQNTIVINTGNDEENMAICRLFTDRISKMEDEREQEAVFSRIRVFVFGDPRYETIYDDIVSGSYGCIHYVNKYRNIAIDFIDKYPLSQFMDEEQIDYETSLVKEGVHINVLLLGFGSTNQHIFLTSVANNQFIGDADGDGAPSLKPVRYYIFDRNAPENNKNLNHGYNRFAHECADVDPNDYLPLPAAPAEETYYFLDINDSSFYDIIMEKTSEERDANFIIIAFGTDLENIDMAQKLVEKRREWGAEGRITIFVKSRGIRKEQSFLEEQGCYFFGDEKEIVYKIDRITDDKLFLMAQMRNEAYDVEYEISQNRDLTVDEAYLREIHKRTIRSWHKKSRLERESSIYCCLSLRSKLHLMGLDYCSAEDARPALTEEEYLSIYAKGDMFVQNADGIEALGKPVVSYTIDFPQSRRRNMAVQEHHRWNSFMISHGIIPATKEQILHETVLRDGKTRYTNGKNYALRRHGNLTTFEGLVTFRQMVAARDGEREDSYDVIKYDYQLLDDAYWFLTANGYKIVRRTDA